MKSKAKLLLIGAGGHARSCIDVVEQENKLTIVGLVGLQNQRHSTQLGYPILWSDDDLPGLAMKYDYALIAVGQIKITKERTRLYYQAINLGFKFPVVISPNAYVSPYAKIGQGSIVMHGAVVNAGAEVGENCIVNSHALIEHDTCVGDHCHISTGAILNGNINVGSKTFIGSGSVIKESVKIGEACIVGAGVLVRHDLVNCTNFKG